VLEAYAATGLLGPARRDGNRRYYDFRDRLFGRIEPRIDRKNGFVGVLNLWWDDSFEPRRVEGFVDAMQAALGAYLQFASASRLEWPPHLSMERQLFLTRP
jgi:hypothetical protein